MTIEDAKEDINEDKEFLKRCELWEMDIKFNISSDGKNGSIQIIIQGETRDFHPIDFCETLFFIAGEKADDAKFKNGKLNLNEQARIFLVLKSNITQIVERFKRKMEEYPDCKQYDFSGIYRQIEVFYERTKLNLDIKLLNSQIKANKSNLITNENTVITNQNTIATNENIVTTNADIQQTNTNIRGTNTTLRFIFGITAGIYLLQLIVSSIGIWQSNNKSRTQLQSQQQDSLLKIMEIRLYQKDNQRFHNLHEIDSLKNVLKSTEDSLHHKLLHHSNHS